MFVPFCMYRGHDLSYQRLSQVPVHSLSFAWHLQKLFMILIWRVASELVHWTSSEEALQIKIINNFWFIYKAAVETVRANSCTVWQVEKYLFWFSRSAASYLIHPFCTPCRESGHHIGVLFKGNRADRKLEFVWLLNKWNARGLSLSVAQSNYRLNCLPSLTP